jgi:hypothetical protein
MADSGADFCKMCCSTDKLRKGSREDEMYDCTGSDSRRPRLEAEIHLRDAIGKRNGHDALRRQVPAII